MRYLTILTPKPHATEAEFQRLSLAEERRVWELYKAGHLREMHFQPHPIRVTLFFEAGSPEEVRAHIDSFPMVQEGLFDLDVIELGPWLPIAVLFGPQAQGGAA